MRVNVYAEELTDRVELITKEVEGNEFTAIRFYLALPVTMPNEVGPPFQARGPFLHRPGDDDSAAVTFWGKRDMRPLLRKALALLDIHYADQYDTIGRFTDEYVLRGKSPVQSVLEELERAALVALMDVHGEAKVSKFFISPELFANLLVRDENPLLADGRVRTVTSDLPSDFKIAHAYWDHVNRGLVIVGISDAFEAVDLALTPIPEIVPTMTVSYAPAPATATGDAAMTRVLMMAHEESQHPGDNEQRFRALIRIRDFARKQLDSAGGITTNGEAGQRAAIVAEIERERAAQDRQWGGPTHDDSHNRLDWCEYIRKQAGLALRATNGREFEERMIKAAALAVAAIESSRRCAKA